MQSFTVPPSPAGSLDTAFSCYVTIMNRTSSPLRLNGYQPDQSSFNPSPPPSDLAAANGQVFFSVDGVGGRNGSGGTVTYDAVSLSGSRSITFSFSCQAASGNVVAVPLNQTPYYIDYYGTTQITVWNPDGSNWGPPNNYPLKGHPLNVLFVVSELH